jgi:hypothetical protein
MGSDEHHGLLGGSAKFVNRIKEYIPELDNQVLRFLEAWKYNKIEFGSDISWLPSLLKHVYNQEIADELLQEFNI